MTKEIINSPEYVQIIAVKSGEKIKRYEVSPLDPNGFYRVSEDRVERGIVYFPGSWEIERILNDIGPVAAE